MFMRFFTLDWWLAQQETSSDENCLDAFHRYAARLESIRHRLPASIASLESTDLHDARLVRLTTVGDDRTVVLEFDRQVRISFLGVSILEFGSDPDRGLPGSYGFGDFGYREVDLAGERFEYRGIFSSGIEMRIVFDDARVTRSATS